MFGALDLVFFLASTIRRKICVNLWPSVVNFSQRPMATYVYETIPKSPKQKPKRFELQQKMSDPALTKHPETGEPIRRVIVGGSGWVTHGAGILSMNTKKR